jgi:hypothetical protein
VGEYDDGNRMVLDETHLVEGSFSSGSARILFWCNNFMVELHLREF